MKRLIAAIVFAAGISGCTGNPAKDADHDGTSDYRDRCPNTPEGVQTDRDGCPL